GARKIFDGLGVHPYESSTQNMLKALRGTREALNSLGATKTDMWITEFGWSTTGPVAQGRTKTESQQAQLIKNSLTKIIGERKKLRVRSAIYYSWIDLPPHPGGDDYWGLHTGILRPDGSPKPALNAFGQADKYAKAG
ncbi:MAG: hypothetical protein JHC95_23730, partial [Solirubrobacteraceae bacterium]|nr:hypothetical protein [Solirubrobacteraceae bacterium]